MTTFYVMCRIIYNRGGQLFYFLCISSHMLNKSCNINSFNKNFFFIYNYHHVVLIALSPLTHSFSLSLSLSLSFITFSRSSRLHLVSVQSWCMLLFPVQSIQACPCVEVHKRISVMNSSFLLQQCWSCLFYLDGFWDGK